MLEEKLEMTRMGIVYVNEIDDLVPMQTVFASATDKAGLLSNRREDGKVIEGLPDQGLIGVLFDVNPDALVVSTGGTARVLRNAGYQVMEIADYAGWDEMDTGLVKSMQAKLFVGMLAHPHTPSDVAYMKKFKIPSVDGVFVNFYPFKQAVADCPIGTMVERDGEQVAALEAIRQNMDVGGPTAAHTARKGFLTTAVATRPEDYAMIARDLQRYDGRVSLATRFTAMQHVSDDLAKYHSAINVAMQGLTLDDVMAAYATIHNRAGGE